MWSPFKKAAPDQNQSLAEQYLEQNPSVATTSSAVESSNYSVPLTVSDSDLPPLVKVYSQGIEALLLLVHDLLNATEAREDINLLVTKLPYQITPELYSQMATEPYPTFLPLYKTLAGLDQAAMVSNFHFLYLHYLEILGEKGQNSKVQAQLQKVFLQLKTTVPQEQLIAFLDILPTGFLDEERGALMGRDELLKVLDELRAEKDKVEEAKIRDEALLASIGDGVVAVNSERQVIFTNQSALQLLHLTEAEIANQDWFAKVKLVCDKGEDVPDSENPINQTFSTQQKVSSSNYSFQIGDQPALPVAITATPFILNDQLAGAMIVFKDITRERELDRQKSEFISVASHQLRTPLGSMKWNLELLTKGYYGTLSEEANKIIKDSLAVNDRTIKLVNTLLNISRIESGRVQGEIAQINVAEVLTAILKELEPLSQAKKLKVVYRPPQLPIITINTDQLREALENIISNAIKYSAEAGQVQISAKADAEVITVEVADEGMGIPEKEQFKVFSRFFRAENAISHEPNGSGFGLFVVKSYVESWGGKVWFQSPTLPSGKGTTFFVQIPLQPITPAAGLEVEGAS